MMGKVHLVGCNSAIYRCRREMPCSFPGFYVNQLYVKVELRLTLKVWTVGIRLQRGNEIFVLKDDLAYPRIGDVE